MSSDLIITGKTGVLNQQRLLNSTSNNINNVNTEGFIRKETQTYTSCVDWGVGATYTRRIYDQYVQRQMYVDSGAYNYHKAFAEGLDSADKLLSDDANSLANAMSDFFDELSTAAALPTSSSNRQAVLQDLKSVLYRYQQANESIRSTIDDVNGRIHDNVTNINSLTESIGKINRQIHSINIGENDVQGEVFLQMLDERDRLINELSEYVSVQVVEQSNGDYEVYMDNGMLLANGETYASLTDKIDTFDATKRDIYLSYRSVVTTSLDKSNIVLSDDKIGGSLGGYLNATDELRYTLREMGKLMVAFSDGLNVQNQAGFTLEDVAGSRIVKLEDINAVCDNPNYAMTTSFIEGQGTKVQGYIYEVDCIGGQMHVYTIDSENKRTEIPATELTLESDGHTITLNDHGIQMYFKERYDDATMLGSGSRFRVQPTFDACLDAEILINKPEDFAFASAVRTKTASNNYGNAVISLASCTNTGPGYGVYIDGNRKPQFNTDAPNKVVFDGTNYVIFANDGTQLGYTPASTDGIKIFANALDASGNKLYPDGKPGYDINITGTVKKGDTFTVEINNGGQADNSNANALISLRKSALVRDTGSSKIVTCNEGYANILAHLGSVSSSALSNGEAAKTKYDQTVAMYESKSGVNLDEEAANLLMFQQSYQACAKIIEASQTIFNALIQAF